MNRINTICSLATRDYTHIYDTCCDHGIIGMKLGSNNAEAEVHFIDIVPNIISKLEAKNKNELHHFHVTDASKYFYVNSSSSLVVIAGVGANTVIKILSELESSFKGEIILCGHRNPLLLREYLSEKGWLVEREVLCEENDQYYEIMKISKHTGEKVTKIGYELWKSDPSICKRYQSKLVDLYKLKQTYQDDDKYNELLETLEKLRF